MKSGVIEQRLMRLEKEFKRVNSLARHFNSWTTNDSINYRRELRESFNVMQAHALKIPDSVLLRLCEVVLETRIFFQALKESYGKDFNGALLRGFGQEAVGAGVALAMADRDSLIRDHRSVSAALARGTPVYNFWASHLMRTTSPSGGYDSNVHFKDTHANDLGFLISDMAIPVVLINGTVWYLNNKARHELGEAPPYEKRACGVAIVGDGAASNGVTFAGMNFAKTWRLPVLFTILNNQIALRTPPSEEHGNINLANRAVGFEMPGITVDGDDALEVYLGAYFLLEFARRTNHPALLHAVTFRRAGHNDTERTNYVEQLFSADFLKHWLSREKDPLFIMRQTCAAAEVMGENDFIKLRDGVQVRVREAYKKAANDPEPTTENFRSALIDPHCQTVAKLAAEHPAEKAGARKIMNVREAIQQAFREEFAHDPLLIMLGEDIGWPGGGVFELTTSLITDDKHPEFREHIRNAPLDEAAISGFLAGVCLLGGHAIAEYQFWNFFLAGASVPLTFAATRPFMQKIGVGGVLRGPTGYAPQSNHYHESWPETYLLKALGIKVVVPSTPEDFKGLMKSAVRDPDLVAFLEEMSYYGMRDNVPEGEYFTPFKPVIRNAGKDVTVITWGPKMLQTALNAAEELAKNDIGLEIIDLRVLNPLDKDFLFASIRKTGRVVILYEDSKFMGFGAEIAASIFEDKVFYELKARGMRVAALNTPIPTHLVLEDFRIPNKGKLVDAVMTLMKES